VLSTLAASRTGRLLAAGHPAAAALTGGYHLAFGVGAGLAATALVAAALVLRPTRAHQVTTGQVTTGQAEPGQVETGQAEPLSRRLTVG
jgi:hypothetical protein